MQGLVFVAFVVVVGTLTLVGGFSGLSRKGWKKWLVILLILEALGAGFVVVRFATTLFGPVVLELPVAAMAKEAARLIVGLVAGLAAAGLILWLGWRLAQRRDLATFAAAAFGVPLATLSLFLIPGLRQKASFGVPLDQIASKLPAGFTLREVIEVGRLQLPTAIVNGEEGQVFVGDFQGRVHLLENIDEPSPRLRRFADGLGIITGLVYTEGNLYAAGEGRLSRIEVEEDGTSGEREVLVQGLPHFEYDSHSNNGIAFGPDGRLYITLGGTSDHGPEEHPLAGSILVARPDGSDLKIYARGLRNPYDITFCSDGRMFVGDNGPDHHEVFDPPDEVNQIREGLHYGYPDYFGYPPSGSGTEDPVALLPAHSAPTGIACYKGGTGRYSFPAEYRDDLFLTLWERQGAGLRRAPGPKLLRIHPSERNGRPAYEASDFLVDLGNPIDVLQYTDGSLLVLDFGNGRVLQVTYRAN